MKKLLISFFMLSFFFPSAVQAASPWYYPVSHYTTRDALKTFNQLWTKAMYQGREALFPSQFTGYHAAIDLEITADEADKTVPVYAVADGTIIFAGPVSGYGQVILESLNGENHTALYGHVKPGVTKGQAVKAGQEIGQLGKGFTNETGGERKHLHFGIYKDTDQYFKGYETTEAAVTSRWEDPSTYLASKGAKAVGTTPQLSPTPTPTATNQPQAAQPKQGWWSRFSHWLSSLL